MAQTIPDAFHTAQPPTPSKIAVSHCLGQALIAVTRDGREWAAPAVIAGRVDLAAVLAAVRRAADVARDVAEHQNALPESLATSGQVFVPAAMLAPSIGTLHTRLRGGLVPAGDHDILKLGSGMRGQRDSTRLAAQLLDATARVKPPPCSPRARRTPKRVNGLPAALHRPADAEHYPYPWTSSGMLAG